MKYKTTMVLSKQNPVDHCFIVEVGRCSYTVLYGQYINGGWCAIPNWNISCDMGEPEDIGYNADKLFAAFAKQKGGTVKEEVCVAIANALADVYS